MYASRISFRAGVEEEKCLLDWKSREEKEKEEKEGEEVTTRAVGYSFEAIMVICSCIVHQNREEKREGEEEETPACEGHQGHLGTTCGESSEVLPVTAELLHSLGIIPPQGVPPLIYKCRSSVWSLGLMAKWNGRGIGIYTYTYCQRLLTPHILP
jgi:hypothetical protein